MWFSLTSLGNIHVELTINTQCNLSYSCVSWCHYFRFWFSLLFCLYNHKLVKLLQPVVPTEIHLFGWITVSWILSIHMVSWKLRLGWGSNDGKSITLVTLYEIFDLSLIDGVVICLTRIHYCTLRIMRKKRDGSLIYWLFSILVLRTRSEDWNNKERFFP